jgi:sugar/nucleoside kinase (ribokinase family)
VITRGPRGASIITRDEVLDVPAQDVPRVIDTTGAGDLFAAGFLFGYTNGYSLENSAILGSIAAGEVISHVGPRPLVELRTLLPQF